MTVKNILKEFHDFHNMTDFIREKKYPHIVKL